MTRQEIDDLLYQLEDDYGAMLSTDSFEWLGDQLESSPDADPQAVIEFHYEEGDLEFDVEPAIAADGDQPAMSRANAIADLNARADVLERQHQQLEQGQRFGQGQPFEEHFGEDAVKLSIRRVIEEENRLGLELTANERRRAVQLELDEGASTAEAVSLVDENVTPRLEAHQQDLHRGRQEIAELIGRQPTEKEVTQLLESAMEGADEAGVTAPSELELDLAGLWQEKYGAISTDADIRAVRAAHDAEVAELRESGHYSAEYIDAFAREGLTQVDKAQAELRQSGRGEYDLRDAESRKKYIDARSAPPVSVHEDAAAIIEDGAPFDPESGEKPSDAIDRIMRARQAGRVIDGIADAPDVAPDLAALDTSRQHLTDLVNQKLAAQREAGTEEVNTNE